MRRRFAPHLVSLAALLVGLQGLPAAYAQGVAWVSSEKDHALTLVDLKTQAVTGTVATCKRPRHMQLTPDGRLLAVACGESAQADFIDLATRKSVRKLPLGDDPEIFDIAADGKTLYVSNEEDAALGIVELAGGKRTGEVKVGGEPEGVKIAADGKLVYVTSEATNAVHAVDPVARKVVHTVKVGKRPRRGRANHVAVVDVGARKVTDLVLVGKRSWSVALDKSEKILVVVNGLSDDVTLVDVATAKAVRTIKVGRVPHSAVIVE